jgi:hypothetical protein
MIDGHMEVDVVGTNIRRQKKQAGGTDETRNSRQCAWTQHNFSSSLRWIAEDPIEARGGAETVMTTGLPRPRFLKDRSERRRRFGIITPKTIFGRKKLQAARLRREATIDGTIKR